jgi:hypothetical protein
MRRPEPATGLQTAEIRLKSVTREERGTHAYLFFRNLL